LRYRVTWSPDAFRRLIQEWTAAAKPDAGIQAFEAIEQLLSNEPELQGESRGNQRRILIVPPIGVIFWTNQDASQVVIIDAWIIRSIRG
jgi:hypothetical protein